MWTLEIALPIIRQIAPIAKQHGFDLAFYGSVLTNGQGDDLDLYFIEAEVNTKVVHARDFLDVLATLQQYVTSSVQGFAKIRRPVMKPPNGESRR